MKKSKKYPNAKLGWTEVTAIRNNKTFTHRKLAKRYGVSSALISMIKREVVWPERNRPKRKTLTREEGRALV